MLQDYSTHLTRAVYAVYDELSAIMIRLTWLQAGFFCSCCANNDPQLRFHYSLPLRFERPPYALPPPLNVFHNDLPYLPNSQFRNANVFRQQKIEQNT